MTSGHSTHRDLAWALKQQAKRAGERAPSVRGSDWQLAAVTAVNTDGTVDTADIPTIRRLESYDTPAVGDVIVIDQNSAGNWITRGRLATSSDPVGGLRAVRRTTDTSRANTTTYTADSQLTLPVTANAVYLLDGFVKYSGANDFQLGWTFPSGCNGEWGGHGNGTTVVSGTGGGGTQQDATSSWGYTVRTESTDIAASRVYGGISTNAYTVLVAGTLRVGATAGNFALAWAQGSATATATFLYTDSWMRLHRVA